MCVYKVWQHGFKTEQTLHVSYDKSRSELCEKCNYCVTKCFIELDPRQTEIYDSCINCGECITACNNLQAKNGRHGLLSFKIGDKEASNFMVIKTKLSSLSSRVHWTIPVAVLGLAMFTWGLFSYERYHLSVYRADTLHGAQIDDYRIAVSNKLYKTADVQLEVIGLDADMYYLDQKKVSFLDVGRIDLNLNIKPGLKQGLHSFIVKASTADGWKANYRVQHFVASK